MCVAGRARFSATRRTIERTLSLRGAGAGVHCAEEDVTDVTAGCNGCGKGLDEALVLVSSAVGGGRWVVGSI
jgi:hypothetical protein